LDDQLEIITISLVISLETYFSHRVYCSAVIGTKILQEELENPREIHPNML
jgi:hypothetical protein